MKNQQNKIQVLIIFIFALIITNFSCSERQGQGAQLAEKLQTAVADIVCLDCEDPIYNAVLFVESPKITWKGAAGLAADVAWMRRALRRSR